MTKNKNLLISFVLVLLLCVALTGCMFSNNEPVEPVPSPAATVMPNATDLIPNPSADGQMPSGTIPESQNAQDQVVQEKFDWRAKSAMVEGRIDLFSEIAESRVVAYDQTALVGVKFASQYQGELTQRIRDMIAGEVMAADQNIKVVAVTADSNDVATIYDLAEKLKTGVDAQTLKDDIDKIVRNATTLR